MRISWAASKTFRKLGSTGWCRHSAGKPRHSHLQSKTPKKTWEASWCLNDPFTNPSLDVPELHNIGRSTNFEALKCERVGGVVPEFNQPCKRYFLKSNYGYSFRYFSRNVIITITVTFFQKKFRYSYNYISVTFECRIENDNLTLH